MVVATKYISSNYNETITYQVFYKTYNLDKNLEKLKLKGIPYSFIRRPSPSARNNYIRF